MPTYISPSAAQVGHGASASAPSDAPGVDPIAPNPSSFQTLGVFANTDDGDDAQQQPIAWAGAVTGMNARGVGKLPLGLAANGTTVVFANTCAGAFPTAGATVFVDPGDVGAGGNRLPVDKTLLTQEQLEPHPSVFFRNAERVRGMEGQGKTSNPPEDLFPINAPGPTDGVSVFSVVRPPIASAWTFLVDGQVITGLVIHPNASDLRRPRDVWNEVIVPAVVQKNNSRILTSTTDIPPVAGLTPIDWQGPGFLVLARPVEVPGPPPNNLEFRWSAVITRMSYLDYARFEFPLDLNTQDPIAVPVY